MKNTAEQFQYVVHVSCMWYRLYADTPQWSMSPTVFKTGSLCPNFLLFCDMSRAGFLMMFCHVQSCFTLIRSFSCCCWWWGIFFPPSELNGSPHQGHPAVAEYSAYEPWRCTVKLKCSMSRVGCYGCLSCSAVLYLVLYCTVLYCTVLYCTVLYCTDIVIWLCLFLFACGAGAAMAEENNLLVFAILQFLNQEENSAALSKAAKEDIHGLQAYFYPIVAATCR